jgi:hypothetical protein
MSAELSYVLVTPHSIRKSRTGAILSRLISRTALDLVARQCREDRGKTLIRALLGAGVIQA